MRDPASENLIIVEQHVPPLRGGDVIRVDVVYRAFVPTGHQGRIFIYINPVNHHVRDINSVVPLATTVR